MDRRQVGPISARIQAPHAYVTLTSHLRLDQAFNHQQTPAVGEDVALYLEMHTFLLPTQLLCFTCLCS